MVEALVLGKHGKCAKFEHDQRPARVNCSDVVVVTRWVRGVVSMSRPRQLKLFAAAPT